MRMIVSRASGGPLHRHWPCLATALLLAAAGSSAGVRAQEADEVAQVCAISGEATGESGVESVQAACWGTGLVLGNADQFETHTNTALRATLVKLVHGDRTRVLLLRSNEIDQPIIEDLRASLAVSAGRGPLGDIDGLTIDFSQFETNGVVGVEASAVSEDEAGIDTPTQPDQVELPGDTEAVSPDAVDVAAIIENDPAANAAPVEQ